MYNGLIEKLKDKKICILGYGKEGISTYNFLTKHGITNIKVHDLVEKDVDGVYGETYLDNLEQYDVIIKGPGVILKNIDISKFEDKITSQLEMVMECNIKNIIGITGSKGKSTTTSLIYQMLKEQGKDVFLLGNVGIPILDYIDEIKEDSYLVIEMAALQLEFVHKSPHIGVITNFYPEHLDFFKDEDAYYKAKLNILKYQNSNDYGIYCSSNEMLDKYMKKNNYQSKIFASNYEDGDIYVKDDYIYIDDKKVYNVNDERKIVGKHNLMNIMLALKVANILGLDMDKCSETINNFEPLDHRMQKVGEFNGITYYDDAIATIPAATINCIDALGCVDTLITGGKDRGISYKELVDYLNNSNVNNVICMPDSGYKYADEIHKNVYKADTLEEAVKIAKEVTKKGYICLLSPSAPSFNQFKNYIEKGNKFQEYVRKDDIK